MLRQSNTNWTTEETYAQPGYRNAPSTVAPPPGPNSSRAPVGWFLPLSPRVFGPFQAAFQSPGPRPQSAWPPPSGAPPRPQLLALSSQLVSQPRRLSLPFSPKHSASRSRLALAAAVPPGPRGGHSRPPRGNLPRPRVPLQGSPGTHGPLGPASFRWPVPAPPPPRPARRSLPQSGAHRHSALAAAAAPAPPPPGPRRCRRRLPSGPGGGGAGEEAPLGSAVPDAV